MIKLTVNGIPVEVSEGATYLDAANKAGVHIPTLCYHPRFHSHAVCRMCLVHVAGLPRPQAACIGKANEGDLVDTGGADLRQFRAIDAQWLLARSAAHFLGAADALALEWHALRGVSAGVKETDIPGVGKVAVCNGIAAAQRMLATETWRKQYVAIEVMACVGGCLGGGGEPKSMDPLVLEKRMRAVYQIDSGALHRRSHENPAIQSLYQGQLQEPNSWRARALLHTSYAARNSKRLLLMRFLDCIDRRHGEQAAALCHPDASWSTASAFGDIQGAMNIRSFIDTRLPPRRYGPEYARHRMVSAADGAALTVLTPLGETCGFSMEVAIVDRGGESTMLIKRLTRLPSQAVGCAPH
ncbi:iron hydrogenase small subunit [Oxalobacteraceae bacterium]|nr:iron hydrogenase small subunit [Oxalobacteraceae bacterium]